MAKSADAADLKFAGSNPVGVQVPLWAPDSKWFISIRGHAQFGLVSTVPTCEPLPIKFSKMVSMWSFCGWT
jgi:hypothetical protein